jgi:hypothetical protein
MCDRAHSVRVGRAVCFGRSALGNTLSALVENDFGCHSERRLEYSLTLRKWTLNLRIMISMPKVVRLA